MRAKRVAGPYHAKAYRSTATGQRRAIGILDKYRSEYRLSIEDFAEQVHAYIERQSPDFRLNFFVDEVGQYIADNVKLMTNLQTIAESLATKSRGRAWVIVTAQEDMRTVVGEMASSKAMTSQNSGAICQSHEADQRRCGGGHPKATADQKRKGIRLLSDIYHEQSNNFKTLFDFADGSQTYRNFQDRDHFIHSYPFIPYQFAFFSLPSRTCRSTTPSRASTVRWESVPCWGCSSRWRFGSGIMKSGQLATFDLMFEGIRTALKSQIQRAIIQAENTWTTFAIRLLKTLFLVKYVKEFKPTSEICAS
jgi:hypothetical protein